VAFEQGKPVLTSKEGEGVQDILTLVSNIGKKKKERNQSL
jgi:hypothetical protein